MKKFSIIAMVLAFTMMLSVVSYAAPAFKVAEDADYDKEATTVTPAADSIAVETEAVAGNYYGILLVAGNALPTVDNAILYINQATAAGDTQDFEVLPIIPTTLKDEEGNPTYKLGDPLTLYISSNVAGAELIAIPLVYDETVQGYKKGDIDNSGSVGVNDAQAALQFAGKLATPTELQFAAADTDGSGAIGVNDAQAILQVAGKLATFE